MLTVKIYRGSLLGETPKDREMVIMCTNAVSLAHIPWESGAKRDAVMFSTPQNGRLQQFFLDEGHEIYVEDPGGRTVMHFRDQKRIEGIGTVGDGERSPGDLRWQNKDF